MERKSNAYLANNTVYGVAEYTDNHADEPGVLRMLVANTDQPFRQFRQRIKPTAERGRFRSRPLTLVSNIGPVHMPHMQKRTSIHK